MPNSFLNATSLATWLKVLDQVEQRIQTLLATVPQPPQAQPLRGLEIHLQPLNEPLERWQAGQAALDQNAAEVERLLAGEADSLQDWLAKAVAAREMLALRVGVPV
jgi:hypothetical protein